MLGSTKRVKALAAPTGFGKTAVYVAYALLTGKPTCFVTESRGLQDQLLGDFQDVGLVDLRGRRNYACQTRSDWTCEEGNAGRCGFKNTATCPASHAEMQAAASPLVVTNYAKWLASKKFGTGMSHFQQVVFDEGHSAPMILAQSLQVVLFRREIEELLHLEFPASPEEMVNWKPWARAAADICYEDYTELRSHITQAGQIAKGSWIKEMLHLRNLHKRLQTVAAAKPENWIADEFEKDKGYVFDPVRVGAYAESAMLCGVPSIAIVSGTLRPQTLWRLGIGKVAYDYWEFKSEFDPNRAPIYVLPTLRVDRKAHDLTQLWIKLDQFASPRTDRKGIVHTISYARRDEILRTSHLASRMLVNPRGEASTEMVNIYKAAPAGTILVSPSVGTGFDFPMCCAPETHVLTKDLRYVEVQSLSVGDELLAFDEHPSEGRRTRLWKKSIVTANGIVKRPSHRLTFSDGTTIVCSEDHPWLCSYNAHSTHWRLTKDITPHIHRVSKPVDYWHHQSQESREAGYLAGIFDGEGHLVQRINTHRSGSMPTVNLGMCQVNNAAYEETLRCLDALGFNYKIYGSVPLNDKHSPKLMIQILRRGDILRFLGVCRPARLLSKFNPDLFGSLRPSRAVSVVSNEPIGGRYLSALSTTSGTFIAEGFASHNTECEWQFICKIPFPHTTKIIKARQVDDPEYGHMIAATQLEQICGRPVRSAEDQAESVIVDAHMEWFYPRYRHLFSHTFHTRVRFVEVLPPPPPKL